MFVHRSFAFDFLLNNLGSLLESRGIDRGLVGLIGRANWTCCILDGCTFPLEEFEGLRFGLFRSFVLFVPFVLVFMFVLALLLIGGEIDVLLFI